VGVPNGEFPEILIAKCRSRFFGTFFHGRKILKVDERDGKIVINRCANTSLTTFDAEENFLFRSNVQ
jgi:hypothetical protein